MTEELNGPVAVIAGGLSHERDVSLASGRNLVRELRAVGVEAQAPSARGSVRAAKAMARLRRFDMAGVPKGDSSPTTPQASRQTGELWSADTRLGSEFRPFAREGKFGGLAKFLRHSRALAQDSRSRR